MDVILGMWDKIGDGEEILLFNFGESDEEGRIVVFVERVC